MNRLTAVAACQPSYAAPVLDLSQAIGGGVLSLYVLSQVTSSDMDTLGVVAAITAGTAALFGASAA